MPTSTRCHDEKRRALAEDVHELIGNAKQDCKVIVGGDWNVEVGSRREGNYTLALGPHSESTRSKTGEWLLELCAEGL